MDRAINCSNDQQGPRRSKAGHRPKRKKHTECFTCSRIYFDLLLPLCPRCGSATVRHYDPEELNYLSHNSSTDECVEFERRTTI